MNTDTPTTNARWETLCCSGQSWYQIAEEMKLDCRKLERELTAARAEATHYEAVAQKAMDDLIAVTEQQVNNNRVIELLKDGLQTDGSHHKQWYLNEVLKLINADIAKDVEMHWTHDKGIAP
jgi:hypothetical protein